MDFYGGDTNTSPESNYINYPRREINKIVKRKAKRKTVKLPIRRCPRMYMHR